LPDYQVGTDFGKCFLPPPAISSFRPDGAGQIGRLGRNSSVGAVRVVNSYYQFVTKQGESRHLPGNRKVSRSGHGTLAGIAPPGASGGAPFALPW
jgi:hypothetical protein